MAKFNEKVLCLFKKDLTQLVKEANRRGIDHHKYKHKDWQGIIKNREDLIAEILYKDAYDAGKNDAQKNSDIRNCPANCCGNAKPEVKEYCLHDMNDAMKYRLELTNEQVTAIEWMIDRGFIQDVEFSEWDDTFEDVGRI